MNKRNLLRILGWLCYGDAESLGVIKELYVSTKQNKKQRLLSETLYCYVEPVNYTRARRQGTTWASFSNYVNYLIAKDHNDKASMKRSKEISEEFLAPKEHTPAPRKVKAKPAKKTRSKSSAKKKTSKSTSVKKATPVKKESRSTKAVVSSKKARKTPGFFGKIMKSKTISQAHAH